MVTAAQMEKVFKEVQPHFATLRTSKAMPACSLRMPCGGRSIGTLASVRNRSPLDSRR